MTTLTQPPDAGSRIAIDRLMLHVPPMREEEARSLAELVGRAMRGWPTVAGPGRRIEAAQATVTAPGGVDTAASLGALADRIAAAVLDAALRDGGPR